MSTRIAPAFVAIAGLVLLAGLASAASRIVTPPLGPPLPDGSVRCNTVNGSTSKTVEYILRIHDVSGNVVQEDEQILEPTETGGHHSNDDLASYCTVEITKGNKKDLRVAFIVYSSGGAVEGAVAGQ